MAKHDKIAGLGIIVACFAVFVYLLAYPSSNATLEISELGLIGTFIGAGIAMYRTK